jgi:formylglycine-generating enzyme
MKLLFGFFITVQILSTIEALAGPMVLVPAGTYKPFFKDKNEGDQAINASLVDRFPVTNQEYLHFLKSHPQWRKSNALPVFTDPNYLEHWQGDLSFEKAVSSHPVTSVSWFAARDYCQSQGKRLMTMAEWEYVSHSQDPQVLRMILDWYGKPNSFKAVQSAARNSFGVAGMHGLIWEWVEDFSAAIVAGDSRSSNETSASMFCGSGSLKAKDPSQYATFMRYAYRSSLKAKSIGQNLGFRCALTAQNKGNDEK